ncbi:MAG TPA: TlyA family RNA methyltransferase [Solirubrobacteraceae bacterium]|nr:TlyA family RNA methyltransferase [Solirubrobacteraceae bacterium]
MGKRRLDALLAERGLFSSRSRAAASVMAGEVRVGVAERRASKPGELVDVEERVSVDERPAFVSRGGVKLANALDAWSFDVGGRRALDVGASTGGFSDCLLQRGARDVIAVDVGYGSLAWSLRSDPRVVVMERVNARELTSELLPHAPDLAVVDVSFISLAKVLGAVLSVLAPGYDVLAMIKPQFEVGRGRVGKGGVVRDAGERRDALVAVGESALALGAAVLGYRSSGLAGPKGNRETFVWLSDPQSAGASARPREAILPPPGSGEGSDDTRARLLRLAREVEP